MQDGFIVLKQWLSVWWNGLLTMLSTKNVQKTGGWRLPFFCALTKMPCKSWAWHGVK
jgi:hypothetical protein